MATFQEAYEKLYKYEAGYSNNPNDIGRETYNGISRYYHPEWKGWKVIDEAKNYNDFYGYINSKKDVLNVLEMEFYKEVFWNKIQGDNIESQEIATEIFEMAVNIGIVVSVKILQKALNYLNRNGKLYSDTEVDGKLGTNTLKIVNTFFNKDKRDDHKYLVKVINILQGCRYIEILSKNPSQEEFIRGWIGRT